MDGKLEAECAALVAGVNGLITAVDRLCTRMAEAVSVPAPQPKDAGGEGFIDVAEAARTLGLTQNGLYGMVNRRAVPYHKVGKSLRFLRSELDEWSRRDTLRKEAGLE